jgi:phosphatidylinositol glycan class V
MISRLAVIQIILAAMAVLSYHVQIITRLSSAYVVWYWWVGICLLDEGCAMKRSTGKGDAGCQSKSIWIVRWMVMYGLVQGVLFAGFLPPA